MKAGEWHQTRKGERLHLVRRITSPPHLTVGWARTACSFTRGMFLVETGQDSTVRRCAKCVDRQERAA